MINVFLLAPDLAPSQEATTARLLALGLPRDRFGPTVGVLGPAEGAAADELRAAGVPVVSVAIRHTLDLGGLRRLSRTIHQAAPAVLHLFGTDAARAARMAVDSSGEAGNVPRVVVSGAAAPSGGLGGWFASRLIRRADRVVPVTWADGERYRVLGVPAERLTRISPAAPDPRPDEGADAVLQSLGFPPNSRVIVTDGQLELGSGPRDAIVAFDMLRYEHRDLHLAVFGAGAGAPLLEQLGRALAFDDYRVRIFDASADRARAIAAAAAVWVTAPHGGTDYALEAMAAGKPVVAWGTPDLTEVVLDGQTGYLVPIGDKAMLASKARALLADPNLAEWMGKAARARAAERFPVARMVEQYARVYAELADS
ncbi:glycosyltransferase family 4 protein [Gemmata sp.]|uniref:glycosyltransferase family 4 protein n=1 Tax=Gemmata sp. TaxID=1914242 RepID=UPI003F6EEEA4